MRKLYRGEEKVEVGEFIVGLQETGCGNANLMIAYDRRYIVTAVTYRNITIQNSSGRTSSGVSLCNDSAKEPRFRRGYKNEQRF